MYNHTTCAHALFSCNLGQVCQLPKLLFLENWQSRYLSKIIGYFKKRSFRNDGTRNCWPTVTAGSDHYFCTCSLPVRPSPLYKNSQNKTNIKWELWFLLAEWIIDDTHVLLQISFSLILQLLKYPRASLKFVCGSKFRVFHFMHHMQRANSFSPRRNFVGVDSERSKHTS